MIEPFLRGRELALWLAGGNFSSGAAVLFWCGGGSGRGHGRGEEWRRDEGGMCQVIDIVEKICANVQNIGRCDGGDSVLCSGGRLFRFIELPVKVIKETEDVSCL